MAKEFERKKKLRQEDSKCEDSLSYRDQDQTGQYPVSK